MKVDKNADGVKYFYLFVTKIVSRVMKLEKKVDFFHELYALVLHGVNRK